MFSAGSSRAPQAYLERLVIHETAKRGCEVVNVVRLEQESIDVVLDIVRNAADPACQAGATLDGRLDQHSAHRFGARGQNETSTSLHPPGHLRRWLRTKQGDAVKREAARPGLLWDPEADQNQSPVREIWVNP